MLPLLLGSQRYFEAVVHCTLGNSSGWNNEHEESPQVGTNQMDLFLLAASVVESNKHNIDNQASGENIPAYEFQLHFVSANSPV